MPNDVACADMQKMISELEQKKIALQTTKIDEDAQRVSIMRLWHSAQDR